MKKIILASTSPRRKEILKNIGVDFEIIGSDYEEDMTLNMKPSELAKFLSLGKAKSVAKKLKNQDCIIIAADTFIVSEHHILGKPKTKQTARQTLQKISNKTIEAITGYTIIDTESQKNISDAVNTKIVMKKITDEEIDLYLESDEALDKAGGFGIQGKGALFVKEIHGDYFNIIGLPIFSIAQSLRQFDISLL